MGGAGDDHIDGGKGDDYIDGGKGDDVLIGGHGADVFAFGKKSGFDKILDFDVSEGDKLDLSALHIDIHDFRVVDAHGGAAINLGDHAEVVLIGVDVSDLSADFFL